MKNVKLRKIIGWILVFVPLLLVTVGERYFPTDISIMVMLDIDGAWFIEHQRCGNVPYIK